MSKMTILPNQSFCNKAHENRNLDVVARCGLRSRRTNTHNMSLHHSQNQSSLPISSSSGTLNGMTHTTSGSAGSGNNGGGFQHRKLAQSKSHNINRPFGASSRSRAQELEQLLLRLDQGSLLVKFHLKGKPERRTFALKSDCGQLVCMKPSAGVESFVNLFEVREVRTGRCSKVFEKWSEDARKYDNAQCFVVMYGSGFRLKSLSCVGEWNLNGQV